VSVTYFGLPMATKRKPMAKPRQKESPCHEGDPSKKSREVRKTGQSEKGSEEGAAPASIAKENQSDGEDRGQSELRYHRDVGGVRIGGLRNALRGFVACLRGYLDCPLARRPRN
jgi:hypothetical protein